MQKKQKVMPFLEADFEALKIKLEGVKRDVSTLGKDMGEACDQSSETWHDNPAYDMVQTEHQIRSGQAVSLRSIFESAIVQSPVEGSKIGLGSKVQMLCVDDGCEDPPVWYSLGSSWIPDIATESDGDEPTSAIRMTYFSPMAQAILGKGEDNRVSVDVGGRIRHYIIMEVSNA